MFKEYFKELKDLEVYEQDEGFILYRITPPFLYIRDIYVKPEFRRSHIAANMADRLAEASKAFGCDKMLGDVEPSNINATASVKVLLSYGMSIAEAHEDEIVFIKDIK